MINVTKLVKWNLARPLENRISYTDLLENTNRFTLRGNLISLYTQIKGEIDIPLTIEDYTD